VLHVSSQLDPVRLRDDVRRVHGRLSRQLNYRFDDLSKITSPGTPSVVAIYLHAVCLEDALIRTLLQGRPALFTAPDAFPSLVAPSAPALKRYARKVHATTDAYLARLTPAMFHQRVSLPQAVGDVTTIGAVLSELLMPALVHACYELRRRS
jgi:hypothetical protein